MLDETGRRLENGAIVGDRQPGRDPWSTEHHVAWSIEDAGHTCWRVQEEAGCWRSVPALADAQGAGLVLYTHTWGMDRDVDAQRWGLTELRRLRIPTAALHLDKFWDLPRVDQIGVEPWLAGYVDHVFTADGGNQWRWEEAGVHHHWLPPGLSRTQCVTGSFRPEFAADVSFVGSWQFSRREDGGWDGYHPEWTHRRELITWLRAYHGHHLKLWPRGPAVRGPALADLYASTRVVVGDSCMVGGTGCYWCVDDRTEILTTRGWLSHAQVRAGDMAYTLNPETRLGEWQPVTAVNRFPAQPRTMLAMEGERHSSLTTPDHRWFVRVSSYVASDASRGPAVCPECGRRSTSPDPRRGTAIHRRLLHHVPIRSADHSASQERWVWRTTATLGQSSRIPLCAPCVDLPREAKWTDAFVELVAWAWTEGSWSEGRYKSIYQSHAVNEPFVARITAALTDWLGPARPRLLGVKEPAWRPRVAPQRPRMTIFGLSAAAGRLLGQVAPEHRVAEWFLLDLTAAQLRLFIDTSVDADGSRRSSITRGSEGRSTTVFQKAATNLDPFEMACAMAGTATSRIPAPGGWLVHLKRRDFTTPARRDMQIRVEQVDHDGMVWCPTTPNGTWLARRRGTVYFTGNSDRVVETLGRNVLLLHPEVDGLEDQGFRDGEHLRTWKLRDWDALDKLINYYCDPANDDERRAIAAAGQAEVLRAHTFTHRVGEMLAVIAAEDDRLTLDPLSR